MTLHLFVAVTLLVLSYSAAYCADFAQVGAVIKTSMPAESPVKTLEDKRHVLCEKCPPQTKLNPIIAVQVSGIALKVGEHKKVKQEPIIVEEKKVLYFPLGKTNPIGGDNIKEIASYSSSIESVAIEGFTCDLGSKKQNEKLALKRAEVVSKMLQRLGVSKEKISVEGLGKCCFKHSPAQSRRVEITITKKQKQGG